MSHSFTLTTACRQGTYVQFLLDRPGVDVNGVSTATGWSNLIIACFDGHERIVDSLLAHPDIDVNSVSVTDTTPLIVACAMGHGSIVGKLLAHPEIDPARSTAVYGMFALYKACQKGFNNIVDRLLAHPSVDINQVDYRGRTPLDAACIHAHPSTIQKLCAQPGIRLVDTRRLLELRWHDPRRILADGTRFSDDVDYGVFALAAAPRQVLVSTFGAYRAARRLGVAAEARSDRAWQQHVLRRIPRAGLAELMAQLSFVPIAPTESTHGSCS